MRARSSTCTDDPARARGHHGLGLARSRDGDHELWGHFGDGLGNANELWQLPRENVTVAVTWNDDLIGSEGGFFPSLLHAAIGPE